MFKVNLSSPHMNITISKNQTGNNDFPSKSKPFPGTLPILFEALKITIQNGAAAACILLPVFLSYSLLGYGANLALPPMSKNFTTNYDPVVLVLNSESGFQIDETTRKEIRNRLIPELVGFFFSSIILIIFLVTTISLANESHTGKKVNTKDLFSRIGRKWKGPVSTSFFMALISMSLMLLFIMSIGIILAVAKGFPLFALITGAADILGVFGYLYVGAVWAMSLVISILEEGSYGLKAIDRAGELMRGKRLKGCAIKLLFVISCGIVYLVSLAMNKKTGSVMQVSMLIMIPRIFLNCVVKFVFFVMFTVFYHECRKCQEESGVVEGQKGLYDPIDYVEA